VTFQRALPATRTHAHAYALATAALLADGWPRMHVAGGASLRARAASTETRPRDPLESRGQRGLRIARAKQR